MYSNQKFINELEEVLVDKNLQGRNVKELEDAVNVKVSQKHMEVMATDTSKDGAAKTFGELLDEYNAWLALDLMLLKLERSVGLMDGVKFPYVKDGNENE